MTGIPSMLLLGDPRLRRVAKPVTNVLLKTAEFQHQCEQLKGALQRFRDTHGFGRAIAAPQINIPYRMIAMNLSDTYKKGSLPGLPIGNETFLIMNPEMSVSSSTDRFTLWDDCMSFPDLLVKVERNCNINLHWMNENETFFDWNDTSHIKLDLAELLQHEIDHLDGVLSPDRAMDKDSIVIRSVFEENSQYFNNQVDYNIYSYKE